MKSPGCGAAAGATAADARREFGVLRRYHKPLIFLIAVGLSLTLIYRAAGPAIIPAGAGNPFNRTAGGPLDVVDLVSSSIFSFAISILCISHQENEGERLGRILKAAAMEDNTVILTTLNAAWASENSIVDVFLESFRLGNGTRWLLDHLVIVAFDKKAYTRCVAVHTHCFALSTEGVDFSGEEEFMSDGYLKMMWRRIDFLRLVLEKGHNFIFTDTDIMWFRNPLPRFFLDGDFQIACDQFNGNPFDRNNRPNGGFNYVKSNNRTISFYKFWYLSREKHPRYHDQDVLNMIKFDPLIEQIGLQMRFLSTAYFGGLCQPSRDFNVVCTMHANCCIGLHRKMDDLRVMLEDWKRYMAMPPAQKISNKASWSVPKNCR
ncbi:Uncharacterized protein AXF42_Ash014057 [Apostasia shenzhenica]|uniref:Glycosyltransferase n=1 Tax=Apostasia shenzhenica TaxID=1088818 RepID=A0A2I0A9A6_9ASPA|nr:Uncharacterized protein AXF42_Ash014057 [Apostasia shenzhenica]